MNLKETLIALRSDWVSAMGDGVEAERCKACAVKLVMTGSAADGADWQPHIRGKNPRRKLVTRFKDAKDPVCIVIGRYMRLRKMSNDDELGTSDFCICTSPGPSRPEAK